MRKKWEYASMTAGFKGPDRSLVVIGSFRQGWDFERDPLHPDELLNRLGAEGWQVVAVCFIPSEVEEEQGFFYQLAREVE